MSSKTESVSFKNTLQVALQFLADIDTPRSLAVFLLARTYLDQSYEPQTFDAELKRLGFGVNWYSQFTVDQFRKDYQATVLLSKLPPKCSTDTTLSSTALAGFFKAEQDNLLINQSWSYSDFADAKLKLLSLGTSIEQIRKRMRSILGRAPSLQTLMDRGEWSSGASVLLPRTISSGESKAESGLSVTYQLATAIDKRCSNINPLISTRSAWFLVPGNLVRTVRKNITTDRTMAMEPEINAFFQRAIGNDIRQCLLDVGINLNDQTINQKACFNAVRFGDATVDIRNASNSVLVLPALQALPSDWADLFEITRSPYGTLSSRKEVQERRATWFEYNMLSSMGNGYTFEFESLLFYVLCLESGAEDYEINVYGDDIILPQRCVPRLQSLLSIFGFEMNTEKSFVSGTFFESCGVYAFHGVDVTPLKIKALLNEAKDIIVLANKVRTFAHLCNNLDGCAKWCLPTWQMCVRRLPTAIRKSCRGPIGAGLCLYVNRDEVIDVTYRPRKATKKVDYQRLRFHQLAPVNDKIEADHLGLYHYRLYQVSRPRGSLMAHGNTVKLVQMSYRMQPIWFEGDWYDFGYWR